MGQLDSNVQRPTSLLSGFRTMVSIFRLYASA
jgi:hypothetical protein